MKKHVLILGSSGMLGHVVNLRLRSFPGRFKVTDVARNHDLVKPDIVMDVTDFAALTKLYNKIKPDIIINCVGMLNKSAEENPSEAILTNSYLPHFLETMTKKSTCKILHISTDCVFSGIKGNYLEDDFMDADGYYGRSKALGEIRNEKDLTIRTSIVGPELHTNGIGLFQWFSTCSGRISGFTDVIWTGVTTVELSKAIIACINEDIAGLYHMVNGIRISKYDLLQNFKREFFKTSIIDIVPDNKYKCDKSLINTRTDFQYRLPDYQKMIADMKSWIIRYQQIYPHYESII